VAIANTKRDLSIARAEHWYRIPMTSARKWLGTRWPPARLAFYQPKVFGAEAFSVNYYAQVREIRSARRLQLFPDEVRNEKSGRAYYQLLLGPLRKRLQPIVSRRARRIVFIPTTWRKFLDTAEINDLFDERPLEDALWTELKRHRIRAERQEFIRIGEQDYALDFAIYCARGQIDVETDGDTWHANPERTAEDNLRDNALEASGWNVLQFTSRHVKKDADRYLYPQDRGNNQSLGRG
jgi:very-short-patch-repair endonuclease